MVNKRVDVFKREATGKLTFKSICCNKNHQYLSWISLENEKFSLGVH